MPLGAIPSLYVFGQGSPFAEDLGGSFPGAIRRIHWLRAVLEPVCQGGQEVKSKLQVRDRRDAKRAGRCSNGRFDLRLRKKAMMFLKKEMTGS
jgi:hypothetical protein